MSLFILLLHWKNGELFKWIDWWQTMILMDNEMGACSSISGPSLQTCLSVSRELQLECFCWSQIQWSGVGSKMIPKVSTEGFKGQTLHFESYQLSLVQYLNVHVRCFPVKCLIQVSCGPRAQLHKLHVQQTTPVSSWQSCICGNICQERSCFSRQKKKRKLPLFCV